MDGVEEEPMEVDVSSKPSDGVLRSWPPRAGTAMPPIRPGKYYSLFYMLVQSNAKLIRHRMTNYTF